MMRSLALLLLIALAGCGKTSTAPPNPAPDETPATAPEPQVQAEHQMDPAKHTMPKRTVAGMLGGKPFVPDRVTLDGKTLNLRQGTGFFADSQIQIFFAEYKPDAPLKLTVNPDRKLQEGQVPSLHVSRRTGTNDTDVPKTDFVFDGYALTLELAARANGKIAGGIYLSLPGAEKSFLAGTFTATYERELNDPPEPEDRPFLAGKIVRGGKPDQSLHVRYAGVPAAGGEPIVDQVESKLDKGQTFGVRSTSFAPRVASLRPGKGGEEYDFARLPPGKYFVLARLDDGPAGWKFVDLAADAGLDVPLAIPTAAGGIEVTVPAGAAGQVQAIPAGLKLDDPSGTFTTAISGALGAFETVAASKAAMKNLAPGKYEVSLRSGTAIHRGEVEVEAGKTAKVELK